MKRFGFADYWFTNYKANYVAEDVFYLFEKERKVSTIVLFESTWPSFKEFTFKTSKQVAVHTINDKNKIDYLVENGVDLIYTDFAY